MNELDPIRPAETPVLRFRFPLALLKTKDLAVSVRHCTPPAESPTEKETGSLSEPPDPVPCWLLALRDADEDAERVLAEHQ